MPDHHEHLIRSLFAAYLANDRQQVSAALADDFRFTSPFDDDLDKATYFERCWRDTLAGSRVTTSSASSSPVTRPSSPIVAWQEMAGAFATLSSSRLKAARSAASRSILAPPSRTAGSCRSRASGPRNNLRNNFHTRVGSVKGRSSYRGARVGFAPSQNVTEQRRCVSW